MIMFADDITFQAVDRKTMKRLLDIGTEWVEETGLAWEPSKYSIVTINRNNAERDRLTLAGQQIREEKETTYLGVSIDRRKTTKTKVLERVYKVTHLTRFLRVENLNTNNMILNALR